MKMKLTASTVAMAVTLGWALPASAQTADSAAVQQQLAEMRAQMEAMAARINTLQSQLDQQNATSQAAAAKADKALAAAEKPAATPKALAWAEDTKISGRMYYNISNVSTKYDGVKSQDQGGFQIKRFYIGVDHKFDDTFSGNVTMDIDNVANSSGKNVGKGFYVKKAYLEAKLDPALKLRLGAADTPWVPYAEGIYGYRHLEKEAVDLFGFGTSSDWGVHAMGDIADGMVSYQVSAMDGGGYRDPKFTNTVDIEGRLAFKYKGFNAGVGAYTGKLGNDVDGATDKYRTSTRFNALLAYKDKVGGMPVTVGGEYFTAKNWKVKTTSASDKAEGYSVFASLAPVEKWSVFGRYDWVKPNKDTDPTKKGNYFNVGVQYSPAKIVDLALMYKHYSGDNGFTGGDFTGSKTYVDGKQDEFGLFGQFRF
ncbi:MAG: hypothetical protein AB7G24_00680 [Novosphingobium sp.]